MLLSLLLWTYWTVPIRDTRPVIEPIPKSFVPLCCPSIQVACDREGPSWMSWSPPSCSRFVGHASLDMEVTRILIHFYMSSWYIGHIGAYGMLDLVRVDDRFKVDSRDTIVTCGSWMYIGGNVGKTSESDFRLGKGSNRVGPLVRGLSSFSVSCGRIVFQSNPLISSRLISAMVNYMAYNERPKEYFKTTCADCGNECEVPFVPTEGKPVYCKDCYANHRPVRDRESRGRYGDRRRPREREFFTVKCAECGNECDVPFKPTEGKPVYCRDCFQKYKPEGGRRDNRRSLF